MSTDASSSGAPLSGPCAPARSEVDARCADAERLAQAAVAHQQRLRDVKRQLMEVTALREADAQVRDRRQLNLAKDTARASYHQALVAASDLGDVQAAARGWLREVDRLNRQVAVADRRAEEVVRRAIELEHALPRIELAADAARIAAEAAQVACLDARRALAACEEEAQRRIHGEHSAAIQATSTSRAATAGAAAASGANGIAIGGAATDARPPRQRGLRPISLVLQGDRETLLSLALHLAEETGVEAGRLQLLLLELRESIATRALEENALRFPQDHPFWSQFPADGSRRVVVSLASMGYRFDGVSGWVDGRSPTIRELALALSHVGLDPRSLRRPAGQEAIDSLWQGTSLVVEEYLASQAPDLELQQVIACLGSRAARLSELWDMWGRLRPLLLTPGD